ncbi:MAG TPA: signal recognition particle-docking protein FtsY [Acidimicrobiia bacterium]|nr:signal recognition particle-docking protein FtsY [Acidimicrobiia bacterium]
MSELVVVAIIVAFGVVLVGVGLVASRRSGRDGRGTRPAPTVRSETPAPPEVDLPDVAAPETSPDEVAEVEAQVEAELEREASVVAEPDLEPDLEPLPRPRLRDRLSKTRAALAGAFGTLAGRSQIDDDTWGDLEEALILADVGVPTTTRIVADVKARVAADKISDPDGVLDVLKAELRDVLDTGDRALRAPAGETNVWMFVGVNGVGKTTTIAKLAQREIAAGHSVIMAAADTFRAAAAEQLATWADRVGADLVRGQEGADPGSVVFDAMSAAQGRRADLVLVDTAGRLHTKVNLMEELKKLRRIVERTPGALEEVLLVIDASTGQNGLTQARKFTEAVAVTGVVLTKLDGTAKGGIVLAIQSELGIPVKVVGVGEGADDLVPFDPAEFVTALFD